MLHSIVPPRAPNATATAAPAPMPQTLQLILVLLGAAVVVVVVCRLVRLPPILGYLVVGMVVGPARARAGCRTTRTTRYLAEFGIVFLMFSIGLEFSLPQLKAMRRAVFGLGLAQVAITTVARDGRAAPRRLRLAGGPRARRRARDELDGDRVEDARGAHGARHAARPRHHGHPAVPGPRGRRVPDRHPVAREGRRRPRCGARRSRSSRPRSRWR